MEKDYLILKRASASRPSGEWNDERLRRALQRRCRRPYLQRRRLSRWHAMDVDAYLIYRSAKRSCRGVRRRRDSGKDGNDTPRGVDSIDINRASCYFTLHTKK